MFSIKSSNQSSSDIAPLYGSSPLTPPITRLGVVLRPSSPELKEIFLQIREELQNSGIEVELESHSGAMIGLLGREFNALVHDCDAFLSIGGDGTLISLLRKAVPYSKMCFGINTGRLGFLTAFMPKQLQSFIPHLKNGSYEVQKHLVLQAIIESPTSCVYSESSQKDKDKKGKNEGKSVISKQTKIDKREIVAINEFLISKHELCGMVDISAQINQSPFNLYRCDGLIIGTPTGSTAYNISAGGSVIYPYCRNILLTPIAPHSLTQRPLVLSDEFVLEFRTKERAKFIIDGQEIIDIMPSHKITIKAMEQSALLMYPCNRDYFSILREKFKWGEEFRG